MSVCREIGNNKTPIPAVTPVAASMGGGARERALHEALNGARRPAPPPMGRLVAINQHVPVKHRKAMTELHLGQSGLERIDGEALRQYPFLERLWLNGNRISRVIGLEPSWRLKELYLHDNAITSIISPSCSLWHLRHLETLDLSNNLLQGLAPTLDALQTKLSLTSLNLTGNPLCDEASYRLAVVHKLRSVALLDASAVTADQRQRAAELFSPRQAEAPLGFGSLVQPYEPIPLVRGRPSAAEAMLAAQVAHNERLQLEVDADRRAAAIREAARPSFDYAYRADATLASSPAGGVPRPAKHAPAVARFEFVPRGRVPALRVRAGALTLSPRALTAAAKAAGAAGVGSSQVYVSFNAWGALAQPLVSRTLDTAVYLHLPAGPEMEPSLRTDEELVSAAAGYERLTQLLATGPEEQIAVTVTLCEATSGASLASARVPVAELVRDRGRDRAVHHARLLLAPSHQAESGADGPFAVLALSVATDWGISRLARPTGCLPKPELPAAVVEARARARNVRELKDFVALSTWATQPPPLPPPYLLPHGLRRAEAGAAGGGGSASRFVQAV